MRWLHTSYSIALVGFLLLPMALAVALSLTASDFMVFPPRGISLRWYEEFFTASEWTGPTLFSLGLAVTSATLATLFGAAAAWPLARHEFPGRDSLRGLLCAPLVVPAITIAVGSYLVWAGLGLLGNPLSLVATHAVVTAPYVLLVVGAALIDYDETQIKAARSLGAPDWTIAVRVVMPQILPALAAAWLLAFVASLDEVIITRFLLTAGQVQTLAVHVLSEIHQSISPVIPASSVVLGLMALAVAIIASRFEQRTEAGV